MCPYLDSTEGNVHASEAGAFPNSSVHQSAHAPLHCLVVLTKAIKDRVDQPHLFSSFSTSDLPDPQQKGKMVGLEPRQGPHISNKLQF